MARLAHRPILPFVDDRLKARFWAKVDRSADCWLWTAWKRTSGYGGFGLCTGLGVVAHRVSWVIANGEEVPVGMLVCHTCDVRACVNPAHLWIGTHMQNVEDMISKGRASYPIGEARPNSKLTPDCVREIRRLRGQGATYESIGARFGVGTSTIVHVVMRRTWGHVR